MALDRAKNYYHVSHDRDTRTLRDHVRKYDICLRLIIPTRRRRRAVLSRNLISPPAQRVSGTMA